MEKCIYCGSKSGYYARTQISGCAPFYYKFDNSPHDDNSSLHDHLLYKQGKWGYCIDCNKRIIKLNNH